MSAVVFYALALVALAVSFIADRNKTAQAVKKAWKAFENILPEFLVVVLLIGLLLAVLNPALISRIIGKESGVFGVILAALVGSITLIPGFVAFPTAALLLQGGAGYAQIGAFLSTLMMVGVITMPVEMKYFGKKMTLLRNGIALVFSFLVAALIGAVMGGL